MRDTTAMGRPREFDEDEILLKIMSLFWEHGYEGTSLRDIMQATDLRKGSLYAAFGDKHAMYLKAIARYEALVVDGAADDLRAVAPMEGVSAFLSVPIDAAWSQGDRRGCFLCNASADKASEDAETQAMVSRGFDKLERALAEAVAALAPQLAPPEIQSTATMLLSVYVGLRVMARSGAERERMEGARDAAMANLARLATAGSGN